MQISDNACVSPIGKYHAWHSRCQSVQLKSNIKGGRRMHQCFHKGRGRYGEEEVKHGIGFKTNTGINTRIDTQTHVRTRVHTNTDTHRHRQTNQGNAEKIIHKKRNQRKTCKIINLCFLIQSEFTWKVSELHFFPPVLKKDKMIYQNRQAFRQRLGWKWTQNGETSVRFWSDMKIGLLILF